MRRTSKRTLAGAISLAFVVALFALGTNFGAMPPGDLWQKPIKVPMNDRIALSTPKALAAVIFGNVGSVSRVVVMQPDGSIERKLLRGEPLYPGSRCAIYFDGIPKPGTIVKIPMPAEGGGDFCRPNLWNFFIRTWGKGTGSAAEVYLCEYNTDYNYSATGRFGEKSPPIQPCCQIMPGGCKATDRFVGNIDKDHWQGLTDRFGNPIPYAGQWNTSLGALNMQVSGSSASGSLGSGGRLSGSITRRFLAGEWQAAKTRGTFKFEVSPTGEKFVGSWSNSAGEHGEWNGDLTSRRPQPLPSTSVWRTRQVHTEGVWRGKVVDVDFEMTTRGNETTVALWRICSERPNKGQCLHLSDIQLERTSRTRTVHFLRQCLQRNLERQLGEGRYLGRPTHKVMRRFAMRKRSHLFLIIALGVLAQLVIVIRTGETGTVDGRTYVIEYKGHSGPCEINPSRLSKSWVIFEKGDDIEITENVNGVGVTRLATAKLKPDGSFDTSIRMFGEQLPCAGRLTEDVLTVQIGPTAGGCTISITGTRFRPGQNVAPGPSTPREGAQPQWAPGASAPTGFGTTVSITKHGLPYRSEVRGNVFVVTSPADDSTFNAISTESAAQFHASLRLRVEHGAAGIFLTPYGEVGPQDGDLFFGKNDLGLVLQRYENEKWIDIPATYRPSSWRDIDWFEITKDGARYEFRVNGLEVGRWNVTAARRGWVFAFTGPGARAEFHEWQVSKPAATGR